MKKSVIVSLLSAGGAVVSPFTAAQAQQAVEAEPASATLGDNEIIVTARKKSESDLDVPVAIQVLGLEQLARHGVQNLGDVSAITPSLSIAQAGANTGGSITLRGIGAPATSAGFDQAVALNLDGMTITDGMGIRFGQFDLQQIEVLQGPQSLYFGKNTSAGIISITSADPTYAPYAMLRAGYNFNTRGLLTEAVLSGPLTDELGARVAFYRLDSDGHFRNPLARSTATPLPGQVALFGPLDPDIANWRTMASRDTGVRVTLKYEPAEAFSAKLKGAFLTQTGDSNFNTFQLFHCPSGVPSPANPGNVPGLGDCALDRDVVPFGPTTTPNVAGDDIFREDARSYSKLEQVLLTGSLDYRIADGLTLSSVTGYYYQRQQEATNVSFSTYPAASAGNLTKREDVSQEFRLSSAFDGPLNGMVGVYYNGSDFESFTPVTFLQSPLPTPDYYFDSRTHAIFGQLTYLLLDDTIELSAGGRYTDEKKQVDLFSPIFGAFATDLPVDTVRSKRFTPEATISWRPSRRINVFATYKKGTKSGGFNAVVLNFPPYSANDTSFADEKVDGFEGGVKSVLLDGALRVDLTGYAYTYKDLQVSVFDAETLNSATRNAANAKIRGVQFSANYQPRQLDGLNLSAALNYSHARYVHYIAVCYIGQTIGEGCNLDADGNAVATDAINQDLGGRPLTNAPDWSGSFSAAYDFALGADDTRFGLSVSAAYNSEYYAIYNQVPQSLQSEAVNLDAQLRLFNEGKGWELALIGKNLTDMHRVQLGYEVPFTPADGTAGTGTAGPGVQSDLVGVINAPFQLMLRLTVEPSALFGSGR